MSSPTRVVSMHGSIIHAKSGATVLQPDRQDFEALVDTWIDLSPVFKEWNDVRTLKFPDALRPPQLWKTLDAFHDVLKAVCSVVELAKINFLNYNDPNRKIGLKFDRTLCLLVAVDLIMSYFRFGGFLGPFINTLWKPLLNLLISIYISNKPPVWTQEAETTLGLNPIEVS